jgi:hypothetical protein
MGKNPNDHFEFFFKRLGKTRYEALILRSHLTAKEMRVDESLLMIFWDAAIKEMNKMVIGYRQRGQS